MTKYRIRCIGIDKFTVEHSTLAQTVPRGLFRKEQKVEREYWDSCKEYIKYGRGTLDAFSAGPYQVEFKTEKEAEEYIAKQIEKSLEYEKKKAEKQSFIDAHPPREVPPYKFLKE